MGTEPRELQVPTPEAHLPGHPRPHHICVDADSQCHTNTITKTHTGTCRHTKIQTPPPSVSQNPIQTQGHTEVLSHKHTDSQRIPHRPSWSHPQTDTNRAHAKNHIHIESQRHTWTHTDTGTQTPRVTCDSYTDTQKVHTDTLRVTSGVTESCMKTHEGTATPTWTCRIAQRLTHTQGHTVK